MQKRFESRALPLVLTLAACSAVGSAPPPVAPRPVPLAPGPSLAAPPAPQAAGVDRPPENSLGVEVQVYPTGVISTLAGRWRVSERDAVTVNLGYNAADRGSNGEHQDETGGGPGAGMGVRRYYGEEHTGWLVGARADIWYLSIDWKDGVGTPGATSGTSDVWVFQPTVLGGYRWRLGRSRWYLDLTAALGLEINMHTSGESVGQGGIGLLGASLSYGF